MNIALILAAGNSTRMKGINTPKQFVLINKKPLLVYTIEKFQNNNNIDQIIVVTSNENIKTIKEYISIYNLNKIKDIVIGGSTRQESVYNGLKYIKNCNYSLNDNILIHDGARPNVTQEIIDKNILLCNKYHAVNTAIKSIDSLFLSNDHIKLKSSLNRDEIYNSQTPQTFKLDLILKAHEHAKKEKIVTNDDCSLVLLINHEVYIAEGSKSNFKITTIEDLNYFEYLTK